MKTIDLFAGCGGVHQGMERAGFETVFANDIEPKCQPTWEVNFKLPLTVKDLYDVNIDELPEFDCLTGGFPCQPFSAAGKMLGFQDTRGTLFFSIAEILEVRKPKTFLLENVKQLFHHDKGKTFKVILHSLDQLGYNVYYKVLNSMDFGVPQNRQRVIIVGFRKELDVETIGNQFTFPEGIPLNVSVRDLLDDEVDEKYYFREEHRHYEEMSKYVTEIDKVYQWRFSYVRENKKNVCPTLMASNMHPTIVLTKNGIRSLTPREGFRLQGFPDTFNLPDLPDRVLFHQIGNSVTVPLIEAVAKNIKSHLEKVK